MRRLADIGEAFSPTGLLHLTTRQDVQYHYIELGRVPHLLRLLAEVGPHVARGVRQQRAQRDVVPRQRVHRRRAVRRPAVRARDLCVPRPQSLLPAAGAQVQDRFSSCPEDCASTAIHDIGLVGRIEHGDGGALRYGFKVIVGGGLGSTPFLAQTLSEFVPLEELLPTVNGILKVFSAHGNRRNKMKARLKFVVHKHGIKPSAPRWRRPSPR
jgi:sulfite reductase (ferredoxin)